MGEVKGGCLLEDRGKGGRGGGEVKGGCLLEEDRERTWVGEVKGVVCWRTTGVGEVKGGCLQDDRVGEVKGGCLLEEDRGGRGKGRLFAGGRQGWER